MTTWINSIRKSLTPVGAFLLYILHDLHVDILVVGIVATWLITDIPALAPYSNTLITGLVVIIGISVFGNKVADILTIIGDVKTGNLSQAEKDLINLIIADWQNYHPGSGSTTTTTSLPSGTVVTTTNPAVMPADTVPAFVTPITSDGYVAAPDTVTVNGKDVVPQG